MQPIITGILLVVFVIVCILSVLLVLVQEPDNSGMGGLLGGGNSAAFGAHSANVLTKMTVVLVVLFFLVTFGIAKFLPSKTSSSNVDLKAVAEEAGKLESSEAAAPVTNTEWWKDAEATEETAPVVEESTAPEVAQ